MHRKENKISSEPREIKNPLSPGPGSRPARCIILTRSKIHLKNSQQSNFLFDKRSLLFFPPTRPSPPLLTAQQCHSEKAPLIPCPPRKQGLVISTGKGPPGDARDLGFTVQQHPLLTLQRPNPTVAGAKRAPLSLLRGWLPAPEEKALATKRLRQEEAAERLWGA